ncbi:hypothetical protein [Symmachiella dynata]|uniref:hypothetical protein n=1 Tax=Symmachiella dynata TaxID=2527995 RepID=UPI0030ECD098
MCDTTKSKLIDPWQLCRDLATWLSGQDTDRANRLIDYHQQQHRQAEKREQAEGAD